jgi:hypothetical protein
MRKMLLFVGCLFLLLGFGTLHGGRLHYQNWFGQPVFAPFAAAMGVLSIGVAIFAKKSGNR